LDDVAAARLQAEEAERHLAGLLTEGTLRQQLGRVLVRLAGEGGNARVPSAMALTRAEMRVLQLLPTHLSLGQIGEELHISVNTVKAHLAAIRRKLQCSSRNDVVTRAVTSACCGRSARPASTTAAAVRGDDDRRRGIARRSVAEPIGGVQLRDTNADLATNRTLWAIVNSAFSGGHGRRSWVAACCWVIRARGPR
jgi:DNA-binding CsgD family transcriptional regulator